MGENKKKFCQKISPNRNTVKIETCQKTGQKIERWSNFEIFLKANIGNLTEKKGLESRKKSADPR